jgi:hypothetical protein
MFWDLAALDGGSVLAVGSTHYSQAPVKSASATRVTTWRSSSLRTEPCEGRWLPAGPVGRERGHLGKGVIDGRWGCSPG